MEQNIAAASGSVISVSRLSFSSRRKPAWMAAALVAAFPASFQIAGTVKKYRIFLSSLLNTSPKVFVN